jgi:hypothetical protein
MNYTWNGNNCATIPKALWLKADALSLSDGTLVSIWTDSSGNSIPALGTGDNRPTYRTSGI